MQEGTPTPPELAGVEPGETAPRRPGLGARLMVWVCILGLVLSVLSGLPGAF